MNTANVRPSVGVASIIWKDESKNQLLLGLGHDPSNKQTIYAMPGGHWESGETLVDAVKREIKEETDIQVENLEFLSVFEFFHVEKQKTYLSIWFQGVWSDGYVRVMEEENKTNWNWYSIEEALALPLWKLDRILIERYLNKEFYGHPKTLPEISFQNS